MAQCTCLPFQTTSCSRYQWLMSPITVCKERTLVDIPVFLNMFKMLHNIHRYERYVRGTNFYQVREILFIHCHESEDSFLIDPLICSGGTFNIQGMSPLQKDIKRFPYREAPALCHVLRFIAGGSLSCVHY